MVHKGGGSKTLLLKSRYGKLLISKISAVFNLNGRNFREKLFAISRFPNSIKNGSNISLKMEDWSFFFK